jgi:hypothetical protein
MKTFLGLVGMIMGITFVSCQVSDTPPPSEPVTTSEIRIPDSPGVSGFTTDKPAGEGSAGAIVPTPSKAAGSQLGGAGTAVTISAVNVRKGPGKTFEVSRVLRAGEQVAIQSCKLGWCKIAESEYVGERLLKRDLNN